MVLSQERERLQIYETVGSDGERSFLCADLFIVSRRKKGKKKKEKSFTVIVNVAPENSASLWLWKKKQHGSSRAQSRWNRYGEHHFNSPRVRKMELYPVPRYFRPFFSLGIACGIINDFHVGASRQKSGCERFRAGIKDPFLPSVFTSPPKSPQLETKQLRSKP